MVVDAPPPPGSATLAAFGASGVPERMAGGRGRTWRVGDIVLRPVADPVEPAWRSQVLTGIADSTEFSIPRPIPDDEGRWVRGAWAEADRIVWGEGCSPHLVHVDLEARVGATGDREGLSCQQPCQGDRRGFEPALAQSEGAHPHPHDAPGARMDRSPRVLGQRGC